MNQNHTSVQKHTCKTQVNVKYQIFIQRISNKYILKRVESQEKLYSMKLNTDLCLNLRINKSLEVTHELFHKAAS